MVITQFPNITSNVTSTERRLGLDRHELILSRVVVYLVEEANDSDTIAPAVLEIHGGMTILVDNHRVVFVEPTIARITVQKIRRQLVWIVRVCVVESDAVQGRIDGR